jgi:hypothetical protein
MHQLLPRLLHLPGHLPHLLPLIQPLLQLLELLKHLCRALALTRIFSCGGVSGRWQGRDLQEAGFMGVAAW